MNALHTYVIAEIGPNHNGSIDIAKQMIHALKDSGADAIKFQLAEPGAVYSADAFKADYQKRHDDSPSVLEMSRRMQIPREAHRELKAECDAVGIPYLCTAFELSALEFLDREINVPLFKIASGELLTIDMLEYIAERKKSVILSTGMATFDDVEKALSVLTAKGLKDITILHCVSNYPAPHEDLNLLVINSLKKKFDFRIGYSDHSLGSEACLAAVALGACTIEKHVTLDKSMIGPDHQASATIEEFRALVSSIRKIERALGSPNKQFSAAEQGVRLMARKSIVSTRDIAAGDIFRKEDVTFKRPGTGLSPIQRDFVIGKKAGRAIAADHVIRAEDIV